MPTDFPRLRKLFISRLEVEISSLGFKRRGKKFFRKTAYGREIISIYFAAIYGVGFEIAIWIQVRHDAAANIANQFLPVLTNDGRTWNSTVGNRLDNMLNRSRTLEQVVQTPRVGTWNITKESDLDPAVDEIMQVFPIFILPYFERFASIDEALRVLQCCNMWDISLLPTRAIKALAVAYVIGNREAFDNMVVTCDKEFERYDSRHYYIEYWHPHYKRMVEELSRRWDSEHPVPELQ